MSVHRRVATQAASALLRRPTAAAPAAVRALCIAAAPASARPLSRSGFISPAVSPSLSLPSTPKSTRRAYSTDPDPGHKLYSFEDVKKLTTSGSDVVIIDVREPGELAATGRIPGAINIPVTSAPDSFFLSDDDFEDRFGFARPPPDAAVLFYCKAGVRSRAAAGLAKQAGWTKVGEYPGSWLDWAGNGGAIEH